MAQYWYAILIKMHFTKIDSSEHKTIVTVFQVIYSGINTIYVSFIDIIFQE